MFKRFLNWIKRHVYEMSYAALLLILSAYVLNNWDICITMTFFEQFDGNNILFLVWIALLILTFYDVEAKGWKFRKKGIEDTRKLIENTEFNYMQEQMNNLRDSMQYQNAEKMEGGSSQNE